MSKVLDWWRPIPAAAALATALWTAVALAQSAPAETTVEAGPFLLTVQVTPNPPRTGALQVRVLPVALADGAAVTQARVTVTAMPPRGERAIGSLAVHTPDEPGEYVANLKLEEVGLWTLTVEVEEPETGTGRAQLPLRVAGQPSSTGWPGVALWLGIIAVLFGGATYVWYSARRASRSRPS